MTKLPTTQEKYLNELLKKIETYSKPSKNQLDILELATKSTLSPLETRRLGYLLNVEKANENVEKQKQALAEYKKQERKQAQLKHKHELYTLGGLFKIELEKKNPAFVQLLANAIYNGAVKTTHKDNTPMFAEFDETLKPFMSPEPQF